VDDLSSTFSGAPLSVTLQAGKRDLKSVSFKDKLDQIIKKLSYDAQREECGKITTTLKTKLTSLKLDSAAQTVSLSSDENTQVGTI